MRWVVTGAAGQLGAYVLRQLVDEGADVTGTIRPGSVRPGFGELVELELTDAAAVLRFLRRYRP